MKRALLALVLSGALCGSGLAGAGARGVPQPLAGHPGNLFLAGERVVIPAPPGDGEVWRAVNYDGQVVAEGVVEEGQAHLGQLPVGYYEATRGGAAVSVGVVAKLGAPTPLSSPVGADVAMAWLAPEDKWATAANLCALAGLNWVRDRLNWAELEPKKGEFASETRYDRSARIQAAAGLRVLQVAHLSPAWANPNAKRFPLDLRDPYDFYRALARRWRGTVGAFEPWNEADIKEFGGHTGSEMASFQKAAWLGLKAGNPDVIACLNVLALHRKATLEDLTENEVWPYFDTYNLHHYEPFAKYAQVYADHRAVCAGRPLWTTECSLPVKWRGDPQLQEPSREDLRLQSERVVMTYALALREGAQAVFYFILPHYVEGETQFGLLHRDLTPRPGYLALAAVGRLLADARPLGWLATKNPAVQAHLFEAKPDGKPAVVLVAWCDAGEETLELPQPPMAGYDHLGRMREAASTRPKLTRAPQFFLFNPGTIPPAYPTPSPPARLPGEPSRIVFQAIVPDDRRALEQSAYKLLRNESLTIPVFVYNFGQQPAKGELTVTSQGSWHAEFPRQVEVAPGEGKKLSLHLKAPGRSEASTATVRGDFGPAGKAVLSLRLVVVAAMVG